MLRLDQSGLTSERLDVVITMNEQFLKLPSEKQQRILHAALAEFARQGYEKASTNRIVKEAGIGKGMLFYYFKSKRDLYDYLTEYSLDFMVEKYFHRVDTSETDFIERFKQASKVKLEAQMENKNVFDFLGTFMLTPDAELPLHIQRK